MLYNCNILHWINSKKSYNYNSSTFYGDIIQAWTCFATVYFVNRAKIWFIYKRKKKQGNVAGPCNNVFLSWMIRSFNYHLFLNFINAYLFRRQFSLNIMLKGLHVPCSAVLHVDSFALDPEQGFLALFAGVCSACFQLKKAIIWNQQQ